MNEAAQGLVTAPALSKYLATSESSGTTLRRGVASIPLGPRPMNFSLLKSNLVGISSAVSRAVNFTDRVQHPSYSRTSLAVAFRALMIRVVPSRYA